MSSGNESRYLAAGVSKREAWSWAMFDFANSGYTTVVITAIFNAYFVGVVTNNEDWGTFAWTASLGVSYALIIDRCTAAWSLCGRLCCKETAAVAETADAFIYRAALFCRPWRSRAGNFADCSVKFFFRLRRKSDCCLFAGTGTKQGAWKSVWLGLEPRLYRRAGQFGGIAGVCHVGAE